MIPAPLVQTWWVEPELLLAGRYPGNPDEVEMRANMQCLLDAGVRCFINLQQPGEMSSLGYFKPYEHAAKQCACPMDVHLDFHRFPIPDMGRTDTTTMTAILKVIQQSIQAKRCVYVHCWGGHGRTGMVVGCWLREQGMAPEEALKRIQELRRNDPILREWESPQTWEQVEMITNWQPAKGRTV